MFEFKNREQSDADRIHDMVYAAMETGNAAKAREVIAEHRETFPKVVAAVTRDVMKDYGIRL